MLVRWLQGCEEACVPKYPHWLTRLPHLKPKCTHRAVLSSFQWLLKCKIQWTCKYLKGWAELLCILTCGVGYPWGENDPLTKLKSTTALGRSLKKTTHLWNFNCWFSVHGPGRIFSIFLPGCLPHYKQLGDVCQGWVFLLAPLLLWCCHSRQERRKAMLLQQVYHLLQHEGYPERLQITRWIYRMVDTSLCFTGCLGFDQEVCFLLLLKWNQKGVLCLNLRAGNRRSLRAYSTGTLCTESVFCIHNLWLPWRDLLKFKACWS